MTKRLLAVCGLVALMVVGLASAANAAGGSSAPRPVAAGPSASLNWDCPAGDFCAWTGTDGNGSRCNWANADADWQVAPVVCSWAGSSPVRSFLNNGRSTRFTGVALYFGSGFNQFYFCAPQLTGTRWVIPGGGAFLRSHQWITSAC